MLISKVQKGCIRTLDEEHLFLLGQMDKIGNFFSWEVHPNRMNAAKIARDRMRKKIVALVQTEEFLEDNPLYRRK